MIRVVCKCRRIWFAALGVVEQSRTRTDAVQRFGIAWEPEPCHTRTNYEATLHQPHRLVVFGTAAIRLSLKLAADPRIRSHVAPGPSLDRGNGEEQIGGVCEDVVRPRLLGEKGHPGPRRKFAWHRPDASAAADTPPTDFSWPTAARWLHCRECRLREPARLVRHRQPLPSDRKIGTRQISGGPRDARTLHRHQHALRDQQDGRPIRR